MGRYGKSRGQYELFIKVTCSGREAEMSYGHIGVFP